MRKLALFLLMLSLVMGAAVSVAQEQLPDLQGREVVIAVDEAGYVPFNFTGPDGAGIGWDYDVFNYICQALNCSPTYVAAPFGDSLFDSLAAGEFDVSGNGITVTPERDEKVDFSTPYVETGQVLVTLVVNESFADFAEFAADASLMVGAESGSINADIATVELGDARVSTFDTLEMALQSLFTQEVDAVVMDSTAAAAFLGQYPGTLMVAGDRFTQDQLALTFAPGSDLIGPFNQVLAQMRERGYLDYLYNKWFVHYADSTPLPDLGGREVVVAVENAYPPFNFIDLKTGEPIGWDYDAFNYICWLINCTPVYQQSAFSGLFEAMSAGEFDVSGNGVTITENRDQVVDFSLPYMNYGEVMLTRLDEARFSTVDGVAANPALRVATQIGTTNELTGLEVVGSERVDSYETFDLAVQALITGDADVVFIDSTAATAFAKIYSDQLQVMGTPFTSNSLGMIFSEGSDLVEPFNQAIRAMQMDGSIMRLYDKWFVDYQPDWGPVGQ